MTVCAIIVTYNGIKWIKKCIDSIIDNTVPIHIIVVDNSSTDGTTQFVESNFKSVELIKITQNVGFGKANNIGIRQAIKYGPKYILLLNQDAYISSDTIINLIAVLKSNSELGLISPYHLNYDGKNMEHYFKEYIVPQALRHNSKIYYEVPFIHAACWLIPISTVIMVGGFDPLFFHYGEDNDYIQRVKYHSYKVGYTESALLFHHGVNSSTANKDNFEKNRILLILKNPLASHLGLLLLLLRSSIKKTFHHTSKNYYFYWLINWSIILKSRRDQMKQYAYLNN